jgi:endonuclease/exonuclease/phosphatase family metal-dependent hydrolase
MYITKKKLKRQNKSKKIQKGGNKSLTIMTFNLEIFLEIHDFDIDSSGKITKATRDEDKMEKINGLVDGVDILCTQENVLAKNKTLSFKNEIFYPELGNLKMRSICYSHPLGWPKSKFLYSEKSFLANAIYSSSEYINNSIKYCDKICKTNILDKLPRCYSSYNITFEGKPIVISSIHLSGGRFDDKNVMMEISKDLIIFNEQVHNLLEKEEDEKSEKSEKSGKSTKNEKKSSRIEKKEKLIDEKKNQIGKMIEGCNPDIICGDFNTKIETTKTKETTRKYSESIYEEIKKEFENKDAHFFNGMNDPDNESKILQYFEDIWMFMTDIHSFLNAQGYESVYSKGDWDNEDTSAYGGIVDYIYYKKDTLRMKGEAEIVGNDIVMKKNSKGTYNNIVSDHFPVKASFTLK